MTGRAAGFFPTNVQNERHRASPNGSEWQWPVANNNASNRPTDNPSRRIPYSRALPSSQHAPAVGGISFPRSQSPTPYRSQFSPHLLPGPPSAVLLGVKCERFVHAKSNQEEKLFSSLFISASDRYFFPRAFFFSLYIFTGKITTLSLFEFASVYIFSEGEIQAAHQRSTARRASELVIN